MKELIRFTAPWCAPCRSYAPLFEKVEANEAFSDITFKVINIDEDQSTPAQYNVRSIPTTILLVDGKEVERKSGIIFPTELEKMLS